MNRHDELTRTDLDRIARRLSAPAGVCTDATTCARTDALALLSEVRRARIEAALARARYADLLAAARATLSAHADGEANPLAYLRDQLEDADLTGQGGDAPISYLPTIRAHRALRARTPGGDAA